MKRFKSKKKFNFKIIYLILFLLSILFTIFVFNDDGKLLDILVKDNFPSDVKYDNISFLLKDVLNISLEEVKEEVSKEKDEKDAENVMSVSEPLVYLYNTHQEEKYQSSFLEVYNIASTVLIASKILKEYLENEGIGVVVEEQNVADTLHSFNLKYGSSYKISRMFMESAKSEYPSIKYYIDLHRDSSVYDKTTTEIDGEKYARVLFVVGLDHENYEPNLELAKLLRSKIDAYNPSLCRGIMQKSGKGVNGIYNQDFSDKVMLIEVGGQYNNIREVNNTLQVLAKILAEFIRNES